MSRRNQASQSQPTSSNNTASHAQSSTNQPLEVGIEPTTRNQEIWCHFDLVRFSDNSKKARCKACNTYMSSSGNSTLKKHTNHHCKATRGVGSSDQSVMGRDGSIFVYDERALRQDLAHFVIQEGLPFNHFDNPRLTRLIQKRLQPRYTHVSRQTLKRDCIKSWAKVKKELILGFDALKTSVNLTTDVWSAGHGLPGSYLCVTAHWIDPATWQMMKRTIGFEIFPNPHTGENLSIMLRYVMKMFKLEEKVFSISFDNASNNTNAVGLLKLRYRPIVDGIFYHSRCVAHIINLVVQSGLATQQMFNLRESFRKMLQDIFQYHSNRYLDYIKLCHESNSIFLSPNWDVPTRWNSTYDMFVSALRQKNTLQHFHDELCARQRRGENMVPFSVENWSLIQKITDLLKVFKTATTMLSGVYYPTSHSVLNQLYVMCRKLGAYEYDGPLFANMVVPMKEKLKKYFQEIPPVITCAAAINPCYNVSGVEYLIKKIGEDLDLNQIDPFYVNNAQESFTKNFKRLYDVYFEKYGATNVGTSSVPSMWTSSSSVDPDLDLFSSLRQESGKRARSDNLTSNEYGRYTGTDWLNTITSEEFKKFDVLNWWKQRESQFPVLAAMARDLLSVQASTVASESAFSTSGRVLSVRRTKLTPLSLEMCICLKDYLDGNERIQDVSILEEPMDYEKQLQEVEVQEGYVINLTEEEIAYDEATSAARAAVQVEIQDEDETEE